jgi:hypothetical protein
MGDASEYNKAEEKIHEDWEELGHSDKAVPGMTPSTPSATSGKEGYLAAENNRVERWVLGRTPERGLGHVGRALLGMTPSTPGSDHIHVEETLPAMTPSTPEKEK